VTGIDDRPGTNISDVNVNLKSVAAIQVENGLAVSSEFDMSKEFSADGHWQAIVWNRQNGIVAFDNGTKSDSNRSSSIVTILGWSNGIDDEVISKIFHYITESKTVPEACFGTRRGLSFLLPSEVANDFARDIHSLCLENSFIN